MPMEKIEAHSPEWYQARVGRFTASRLWELICKPKDAKDYRPYVYEKAAEKDTGKSEESDFVSDDMAHGVENEPMAVNWYAKLSGNTIEETSEFVVHPVLNFGATSDRNAYNKAGEKIVLEVKCPKSKTHIKHCLYKDVAAFKQKNPKYYWQIVGGALCNDATKGAFVSYDDRVNLNHGLFVIEFDIPAEDFEIAQKAIMQAENDVNEILSILNQNAA